MKNILVVEDDPFANDFYKYILKKAGFLAIIMEDGDEIVNEVKNSEIHLIIMDINLKNTYFKGEKIDGIQLSRYIKLNLSLDIPILLVTAYSSLMKGNKFLDESLADAYITKPIIDINTLLEKINLIAANG